MGHGARDGRVGLLAVAGRGVGEAQRGAGRLRSQGTTRVHSKNGSLDNRGQQQNHPTDDKGTLRCGVETDLKA